jgi:hypothetical protein
MVHKFAEPVTHEFGAFLHITELDLYFATVNYSMYDVKDMHNHNITIGHRTFKFWGKPGGLLNPRTGKVAFEYILSWKDAVGASKCSYTIKPLFGKGTETKTGKTLNLPTVGTQIQIQSSYIEMDEHYDIIFAFLDHIEASRFKNCIDRSTSTIYQMARHVRYHERHEHDVVEILQAIEKESSMLGDSRLIKSMEAGKYEMYKIDSPDFNICKIPTKWNHSVKSYRIKNFLSRVQADPLRHPKLEVFLKSDENQNPTLSEYLQLKKDLDDLIIKLLSFVSPIEYVSDDYFDAERVFEYRYDLPKWDYKQQSESSFTLKDEESLSIRKPLKALMYIALQSEGCAEFRAIEQATEIPERSLWRYINFWKSEGVLETVRKDVTYVYFRTKALWEQAKETLQGVCAFFNFGFKKLFGEVFNDSGVIRQYRERNKNLTKVSGYRKPQKKHFVVESFQQGQSLAKELRELGINFSMGVVSSKHNLPYSRVI